MRQRGRKCQVVDTNVLVVANRRNGGSYACARNCARALLAIKKLGALVVDDRDCILSEYRSYCSLSGQPGIGDSFIRWVHDNRGRTELVQVVALTPGAGGVSFKEFPDHAGLATFDSADKKFVAAANAHPDKPPILQASDSKWWGWKEPLACRGITVEFLCPDEIREVFQRKFGVE